MSNPPSRPLPFAELLKRATPGPFIHLPFDELIWTRLNDGCRGLPIARVQIIVPEHQANAELILRLLSWAHAGGVEELLEAIPAAEDAEAFNKPSRRTLGKRLRTSLALLDGQREDGK